MLNKDVRNLYALHNYMKVDGPGATCSRREEGANGQDLFLGRDFLGVLVVIGRIMQETY
jgi:hypothetical protein